MDHMLDLFTKHGQFDLTVNANGDIEIDDHHTTEDIGICLGQALREALGDKKGIKRYGNAFVPMDEALAQVVVDLSNRPHFEFKGEFPSQKVEVLQKQRQYFRYVFQTLQIEAGDYPKLKVSESHDQLTPAYAPGHH